MSARAAISPDVLGRQVAGWLNTPEICRLLSTVSTEPSDVSDRFDLRMKWHRALHAYGLVGLIWPKEFGGLGLTLKHQLAVARELATVQAPPLASWVSIELVAPILMRWGNQTQRKLLPQMLSGDLLICQGFSEEGAGSDLASVATTAKRETNGWVIDGIKIWTSWAGFSSKVLVLAVTDHQTPAHRGLSCFLLDLSTPGVHVQPLPSLHGGAEENRVWLDEVRVPLEAIVGEPGDGWKIVMHSLKSARGISSIQRSGHIANQLENMKRTLYNLPTTEVLLSGVLPTFADLQARVSALQSMTSRLLIEAVGDDPLSLRDENDSVPGTEILSCVKLQWAQISNDVSRYAFEIGHQHSTHQKGVHSSSEPDATAYEYLRSLGNSIEGGTDEIQRDIIAKRVLDLPSTTIPERAQQKQNALNMRFDRLGQGPGLGLASQSLQTAIMKSFNLGYSASTVSSCLNVTDDLWWNHRTKEERELIGERAGLSFTSLGLDPGHLNGKKFVTVPLVSSQVPESALISGSHRGVRWIDRIALTTSNSKLVQVQTLRSSVLEVTYTPDNQSHLIVGPQVGRLLSSYRYTNRVLVAAEMLGLAARALSYAGEHASRRIQFNRPITAFQTVRHGFAQAFSDFELAWSSVLSASNEVDPERASKLSWDAYSLVVNVAIDVCEKCIHLVGASSLLKNGEFDNLLKRIWFLRDIPGGQKRARAAILQSNFGPWHPHATAYQSAASLHSPISEPVPSA